MYSLVPSEDSIVCGVISKEVKFMIPKSLLVVVTPLFKYRSPPKFKVPFALYEMLFRGFAEVPIEFVMVKLFGVEKLILPKAPVVVIESKLFAELTTKEPPPVKLIISLGAIEEALTFEESMGVVADSAV